jgi:flagellar biosynthesis protein FlhF
MRIKRFSGDSITEVMNKTRRDLGPDAVILQTRKYKEGGFLGFFAKNKVEITAAVEDKPVKKDLEAEQPFTLVNKNSIKKAYEAYRDKEKENIDSQIEVSAEQVEEEKSSKPSSVDQDALAKTQLELQEMHNLLKEIKGHIAREEEKDSIPEPLVKWATFLTQRGISKDLTERLLSGILNDLDRELWDNSDIVFSRLKNEVIKLCARTEIIRPSRAKTTVVALVGPTGVGKTTTIGKLAAGFSIIEKRKVALVTADTYRVAAVEQLRVFGQIIGVPVEVVMTPDGLREALARHRDKELIFIDTAGRSPHHELHMSELEAFMEAAKPHLTMLVQSVTTNTSDQKAIFERFKNLSTHLILTKLDESYRLGNILDLMVQSDIPLAYLTNGQNVPDDIDAATPEKLARYILGEDNPYV